jgi:CheY-like chemotaxis protein
MIAGRPCVLVVDDDPVSLEFLRLALAQAGCEPHAAGDAATANAIARAQRFELLLIDCHLGGVSGTQALRELRALGVDAAAIATSADLAARERERLLAAGFVDTLAKPATIDAVAALVARHAGTASSGGDALRAGPVADAVLDDAGALAAIGGDAAALASLRRLFHGEIGALLAEVGDASAETLAARLHRLRASCGFCGARALAAAAAGLQDAIASGTDSRSARRAVIDACTELRAALAQRDPSLAAP